MGFKTWIDKKPGNDAEAIANAEKTGMDLIMKYVDEITAGKVWHWSAAVAEAENKANAAYRAFVAGGPLADLEAALEAWKKIGRGEA